jgi:methanogenic corrinoid protein MtbC1
MSSFGQQLRGIRKDRGLRQKDLAEALQVAQTTIANYEQGARFPDETTLHRLADFFGVSLDLLLGRAETIAAVETGEEQQPLLPRQAIRYLEFVLDRRPEEARALIGAILEGKGGVQEIYLHVLQPALRELGRRWETGEVDVSEEHYCSEITQSIMAEVMAGVSQPGKNASVFIGFSVSGELHDIGVHKLTDFLAVEGWRAIFLGNNLPTPSILKSIRHHRADVIGISAAMPYHVNPVASLIQVIRSSTLPPSLKIVVGGRVFNQEPELWRRVGADGYASDAARAIEVISGLLGGKA